MALQGYRERCEGRRDPANIPAPSAAMPCVELGSAQTIPPGELQVDERAAFALRARTSAGHLASARLALLSHERRLFR